MHSFSSSKLYKNFAFPQIFHTRKLGEILVFSVLNCLLRKNVIFLLSTFYANFKPNFVFKKSLVICCRLHCVKSPNFLVWKFWGKIQFPRSFGQIVSFEYTPSHIFGVCQSLSHQLFFFLMLVQVIR